MKQIRDMEKHDFAAQDIQGISFSRKSDGNCLLGYNSDWIYIFRNMNTLQIIYNYPEANNKGSKTAENA